MKYLLHCIFRPDLDAASMELGVRLVTAHGLAAAVSLVEETGATPSVSSLLAYERVVEALYAKHSVIPLRYGCLMESESAIVRLLGDRRREYDALLDRLHGMAEMGIRVLCPARPAPRPKPCLPPGAGYLAALRGRYNMGDSLGPEEHRTADRIARLLSGCYTERRREISQSDRGRLLSLYFLTPQSGVQHWLTAARRIDSLDGANLLISGPWPPYNFTAHAG